MLGIMIQGPQAGGYYGIGTDGHGYLIDAGLKGPADQVPSI